MKPILVKSGVVFKDLNPYALTFLIILNRCCEKFDRSYVITSANDGRHCANSYHYKDMAWDVRANNLAKANRLELVTELRALLPVYYDVVLEEFELDPAMDHIHIECDMKKLAEFMLEGE